MVGNMSRPLIAILLATFMAVLANEALSGPLITVPQGNRNATQPAISSGAISRTKQTGSTFEAKYQKVRSLLQKDRQLVGKIRATAARYGIDPMHMVGALVGEHTYNVDALDRLQTYYVKALSYFESRFQFQYKGEPVEAFVARPQFANCQKFIDNYDLWSCREAVFEKSFRGKTVSGRAYPDKRFGRVFFQPFYAGQTFGLGQLNPLTALKTNDLVRKVSFLPKLTAAEAPKVYRTIMEPDSTLAYVAAVIRISIDAYKDIAGFDISGNPGLTATLYNLGDVRKRAKKLARENSQRLGNGKKIKYPQENYYGWLVNDKLAELRGLF